MNKRRGMSLIELLIALSIVAVLSIAITALLQAGARTSAYLRDTGEAQNEVELAVRRIVHNVRNCASLTVPSGTSAGTTFSVVTQADPANNMATYNITYTLATLPNGTRELQETDPRYGTSSLIGDVQSFSVRTQYATTPVVVLFTISAGRQGATPINRTFRVTPRNMN